MAAAFKPSADERDGIAQLSAQWVMNNLPELTNLKFVMHAPGDTAPALVAGSESIVRGLSGVCLVIRGWHNFSGRYYVGQGASAKDTIATREKWTTGWGVVGVYPEATRFQRYLHKYGKRKEMFAPFVVQSKKNGLNFPEGFFAQNRPDDVPTKEDYLTARWLAKPANLFDADMPCMAVSAYILTTPDRAKDMKQKPVYILGHAASTVRPRSLQHTLEESEEGAATMGRRWQESAGVSVNDLSFENMYDGYGMFHLLHLEGLGGYAGIHPGEGLDYFDTQDLSPESRYPISPSGGNIGSGRTRFWLHVDSIQQIQGRAGKRQMKYPANVGISCATFPHSGIALVWGVSPD
jgi:acetyl-CoA acetyltransferase